MKRVVSVFVFDVDDEVSEEELDQAHTAAYVQYEDPFDFSTRNMIHTTTCENVTASAEREAS